VCAESAVFVGQVTSPAEAVEGVGESKAGRAAKATDGVENQKRRSAQSVSSDESRGRRPARELVTAAARVGIGRLAWPGQSDERRAVLVGTSAARTSRRRGGRQVA